MTTVRVVLPGHLKRLAKVEHEVELDITTRADDTASLVAVLDALEAAYPVLRGTIRDQATGKRRAFVRFFACQQDISHDPVDAPLPDDVTSGREPLLVVGAMAGG